MAISTSSKGRVTADINVTPMIDVMLVLLIIFMVVTPLMSTGFQAILPSAKNVVTDPENDGDIVLGIDNEGNYFLKAVPIAKDQLEAQLTQLYAGRDDKTMYFKADQKLKYGRIQEAVEIARRAGVRVLKAVSERTVVAPPAGGN